MTAQQEDIQTLMGLGLTSSQAKVYLSLIMSGKAKGKTIWRDSKVARQDVYRILDELQKKGIVEKIIVTPAKFKAMPLKEGVGILLKRKVQEYKVAAARTSEMLQKFKDCGKERPLEEDQFCLVPEKEAAVQKFRIAFDETAKSIDGVFYWEGFVELVTDGLERWGQALEDGIRLRFIVYNPENDKSLIDDLQALEQKGDFSVRYVSTPPPASLTIFDGNKLLMTISPVHHPSETASLWAKNTGLVTIIADYFESVWCNCADDQI